MKKLIIALAAVLCSFGAHAQKMGSPFGIIRVLGKFQVDSDVYFPKYKSSDTDKVLGIDANGILTLRTKGHGTVTSVGLTMPSAFSVSGSPVTTSGTLTVTASGTSGQYINGTGALVTFPINISTFTNNVGYLLGSNNLSDISSPSAALSNIGANNATNLTTGTIPAARYGAGTIAVSKINASGTASSSTYLRGDGSWNTPAGGSSGSTLPVIYAQDFGLVNDTTAVTANTTAIANMLHYVDTSSAYINRIIFPAWDIKIDSIRIPWRDFMSDGFRSIELVGAGQPSTLFGTVPVTLPFLKSGTIIRTSRTSGRPFISAGSLGTNFSAWHIVLRDLDIRTTNNPAITAVDMAWASQFSAYNLFINTGRFNPNCDSPSHAGATGLITPTNNNGAWTTLEHCVIAGYNVGLESNEHTLATYCVLASNLYAVVTNGGYHDVHLIRTGFYANRYNIRVDAAVTLLVDNMDIERETALTTSQTWQITQTDLIDNGNNADGYIKWKDVTGGVGGTSSFSQVGGLGMAITDVTKSTAWQDITDKTTNRVSKLTSPYSTIAQVDCPAGGSYQAGLSLSRGGTSKWSMSTNYDGSANDFFLYDAASSKARIYVKPNGEVQMGNDAVSTPTMHLYPSGAMLLNNPSSTGQVNVVFQKGGTSVWQFATDYNANGTPDFYIFDQVNSTPKMYLNAGLMSLGGNALSSPALVIPNTSGLPSYANDAAADADGALLSKSLYKITGSRAVYQKP